MPLGDVLSFGPGSIIDVGRLVDEPAIVAEGLEALDEREREMIESIMKFPTRTVEEIMTPRTKMQADRKSVV